MRTFFIFIYRILFLPILVTFSPYYLLKMLRRGGYKSCFFHRFGFVPKCSSLVKPIWIQAVSVGEIEALQPLLELMKENDIPVYLTTTTSTAFKIAQNKYFKFVQQLAYFPLDFWLFSKIAWKRIHPKAVLLMESEIWPEHLYQANLGHTPAYIINGRCSDKSFSNYQRFKPIAKILFSSLTEIFTASNVDEQHFRTLCPSVTVTTFGNLKVDAALQNIRTSLNQVSRINLGKSWTNSRIILGASTWPGEEKMLIDFYEENKQKYPDLRLILVPRHIERRNKIEVLLKKYPFKFCFHTSPIKDSEIYVVDTTGELNQFVQLSDLIFIGKSLPPNKGGQTPIEAASAGKPMVYGPHMENFRMICDSLETYGGAQRCQNSPEVKKTFLHWLENPKDAEKYGQSASKWIHENHGATQRVFNALTSVVGIKE